MVLALSLRRRGSVGNFSGWAKRAEKVERRLFANWTIMIRPGLWGTKWWIKEDWLWFFTLFVLTFKWTAKKTERGGLIINILWDRVIPVSLSAAFCSYLNQRLSSLSCCIKKVLLGYQNWSITRAAMLEIQYRKCNTGTFMPFKRQSYCIWCWNCIHCCPVWAGVIKGAVPKEWFHPSDSLLSMSILTS